MSCVLADKLELLSDNGNSFDREKTALEKLPLGLDSCSSFVALPATPSSMSPSSVGRQNECAELANLLKSAAVPVRAVPPNSANGRLRVDIILR